MIEHNLLTKSEVVRFMHILEPNWSKRLNREFLQTELLKDPMFSAIAQTLDKPKDNEHLVATLPAYWQQLYKDGVLVLKDGCIFHTHPDNPAFLIPKSMRWEVLTYFHSSMEAMHQGTDRTLKLMKGRVYWPGMDQDVRQYVSECDQCRLAKHRSSKRMGYGMFHEPTRPFELVSMS